MREYDEEQSYGEVRNDFIKEYQKQLEQRGKGEELEIVAEGTPFESFTRKKGSSTSLCTSISMGLVYRNCYMFAICEIDEAVSDILDIQDEDGRMPQDQLEQLENIFIFPVNLSNCRDKLEENGIAYFPMQDMAVTFQFCIDNGKRSYCRDVTLEWLDKRGLRVEELFEKVRYKELEQIEGQIEVINKDKQLTGKSQQAILYGLNGFGAVLYPKVMDQVIEKLGSEFLIIPDDPYTAYIMPPGYNTKLQEELRADNHSKTVAGDGHLVLSGLVFKYDTDKEGLEPAMEHKIEKRHLK